MEGTLVDGDITDEDTVVLIALLRKYKASYPEEWAYMSAQELHDDLVGSLPDEVLKQEGLAV